MIMMMMTPALYHTSIIRYSKYKEEEKNTCKKLKTGKKDKKKEGRGSICTSTKGKVRKKRNNEIGGVGEYGEGI